MSSDLILPARAISPTPNSPSSTDRPAVNPSRLAVESASFGRSDGAAVDWVVADGLTDYDAAVTTMQRRAEAVARGEARELVWLVEHPPLFTAGTSASAMPEAARFPVHRAGRGGQVTYHGPGQRVAYLMLDLKARRPDVRAFVAALEGWIIATLAAFAVRGDRREDRIGVWVDRPDKARGPDCAKAEDKIAAIGIRVRRWVSFHGIALNVEPDLSHYRDIVPCGIAEPQFGVTSLVDLGHTVTMADADAVLREAFEDVFGPTSGR